jgi:hypothetical protein
VFTPRAAETPEDREVVGDEQLGGLLRNYWRVA